MKMQSGKPIAAGDLVIVALPGRCCGDYGVGHIFTVSWIEQTADAICLGCGGRHGPQVLAIEKADGESMRAYGWATWRLKRIDPDATPETIDTPRELETN